MRHRSATVLMVLGFCTILVRPVASQTWVELTPTTGTSPVPRRYASAVYDPVAQRVVVFGGQTASGNVNDVWAFDLLSNTWSNLTPVAGSAPAPRRTPASVYDPAGHRIITWSGQDAGFFNDIWSFDLTTLVWTEHFPPDPRPVPRYGAAAIFDPVAGKLTTFAGFTSQGSRFDDTWVFDPVAETWMDVSPPAQPVERCLHSASYDAQTHRMIMYGGQRSGALDDIWAFDLSTHSWFELTPAVRPAGRFFTTHVYDALNHRSTIFGGRRAAPAGVTNEVWLFDLATNRWTLMTPGGTLPSAREGAAGVYIESEDRMVIVGGYDGTYRDDVWTLNDLSLTPTAAPQPSPGRFLLRQNEPNPFNAMTTIRFELAGAGHATLDVYNVAGRRVATLFDGRQPAGVGSVVWNGQDRNGGLVPSGVYLYRLRQGEVESVRKMLLVE